MLLTQVAPPDNLYTEADAIAFKIGSLDIRWYGIMIFFAFLTAIIFVCIKLWKWYKIPVDPFYWFILMGVPVSLLGARFWSCCIGDTEWQYFFSIFSTDRDHAGGIAIEGGVIAAIILGFWWFQFICKKPKYQVRVEFADKRPAEVKQVSVWLYADAILPAVCIAQAIGRWGNYFNQELFGQLVTDDNLALFLRNCLPFMYIEPSVHAPVDVAGYYQPLFFYESIANIFGFLLLYVAFEFIPKHKAGDLAAGYLIWYGILRLSLEPLRNQAYTFTLTYYMSALWIIIGIAIVLINHLYYAKNRDVSHFTVFKNWFIKIHILIKLKKIKIGKLNLNGKKVKSKNRLIEKNKQKDLEWNETANKTIASIKNNSQSKFNQINQLLIKHKQNISRYIKEKDDIKYYKDN